MAKNRKNKLFDIISKVIFTIGFILFIIFCYFILNLDMLPINYILIIFSIFIFVYIILGLFIFLKKVKKIFKIVACTLLIVFSCLFIFFIKHLDTTIKFIDQINKNMSQIEEYYLVVLENSFDSELEKIENGSIGFYSKSLNTENAVSSLQKEITFTSKKYDDIIEMLDALEENQVDALIINESIRSLLSGDLAYLNIKLKDIYSVKIPVKTNDIVKIVDVVNTPFNVFIAGGDSYGSIDKIMNTDVNMIATIDAKNHKILLTSIPRDYYVHLPGLGDDAYDKLTHAGYYGIETSIKAVEELLNININYYAKINFSTVEDIVDSIGGINIYNEYEFCANGCPNICYSVGNIWLNGNRALMYSRERVAFSNGDIQRVKNQQKVISAILDKVISSDTLINNYSKLLSSVSESFSTNLDSKSIKKLFNQQLKNMTSWKIETQNLVGTDYFTTETYTFPGTKLYTMKKNEESVINAIEKIKEFLGD